MSILLVVSVADNVKDWRNPVLPIKALFLQKGKHIWGATSTVKKEEIISKEEANPESSHWRGDIEYNCLKKQKSQNVITDHCINRH